MALTPPQPPTIHVDQNTEEIIQLNLINDLSMVLTICPTDPGVVTGGHPVLHTTILISGAN